MKKIFLFGKIIKSTGYIYFTGTQYREAEGYWNLRPCLKYVVINYPPRVGKYINKHGFYRQCPPKRVKDKNMSGIENYLCVRNIMNVTPVLNRER